MLTAALLVGLVACSSDGDPVAESSIGSSDSVATTATVPDTTVPDTADTATTDIADTVTTDAAIADPVTAESVQLTDEPDTTFESLDASADGSTIAFDNERGVGVLTVESGDISYVVENDDTTIATKPTYLGDGRLAVLIAEPGDVGGTINIVDESGALQPLDLPVTVVDIEGGTNDTIVYVGLTEGARGLGSVQADAASPVPHTITEGLNDQDPTVTPDGTQLAFIRTDSDDAGNEVNTLVTTDVAGGLEFPITASPRGGVLPRTVVVARWRSPRRDDDRNGQRWCRHRTGLRDRPRARRHPGNRRRRRQARCRLDLRGRDRLPHRHRRSAQRSDLPHRRTRRGLIHHAASTVRPIEGPGYIL